jgi:hypothetical protein
MKIETEGPEASELTAVVVRSDEISVRVSVAGHGLQIEAGAEEGRWSLRRSESTFKWALKIEEAGEECHLTAVGRAQGLVHALCLTVHRAGEWFDVTEVLSSESGTLPPMEAFESRWRFGDAGSIGEVFTPSLVPEEGDLVGQHMFRSPALVVEGAQSGVALVVDIDVLEKSRAVPAALALLRGSQDDADLVVGLRSQKVRGHVFHTASPAITPLRTGTVWHRYHVGLFPGTEKGRSLNGARRKAWALGQLDRLGRQLPQSSAEYARQIFPGAIDLLWRQSAINGRRVGAITANRSYRGDVWFSSWFNPLRSSYGLYHYGSVLGNRDWVEMARATRSLVLEAPTTGGLFPTLFVFGDDRWVESHHQGGGPGIFHLMDMSWTMYQLLRWHRDLEANEETLTRAREYAKALASLQRSDGGLPAYVDTQGTPVTAVDRQALIKDLEGRGGDPYVLEMMTSKWDEARYVDSAEDSASLLFLSTLAGLLPSTDDAGPGVLATARGIARYLAESVVPNAKWADFEVYFSCSPKRLDFYDHRSRQWPQNTLCMHHAAAGLLALFEATAERQYLQLAGRVMDRLSLYQQVWDPPWLSLDGFGGYGVMNTDGEWNDARQAQIAETHLDFGRVTEEPEHTERAIAAARAAFTTVFLPASASGYSGWWRSPQGMAAENHGHAGVDQLNGVSGFDWGSGSALATAAYFERQKIAL